MEELSGREVEVVKALARGLTYESGADALGISVETVKTHVIDAMAYGLIDPMARSKTWRINSVRQDQ